MCDRIPSRAIHAKGSDAYNTFTVTLAFGPNYERLLDLKRKYDPDDVFHSTVGHLAP